MPCGSRIAPRGPLCTAVDSLHRQHVRGHQRHADLRAVPFGQHQRHRRNDLHVLCGLPDHRRWRIAQLHAYAHSLRKADQRCCPTDQPNAISQPIHTECAAGTFSQFGSSCTGTQTLFSHFFAHSSPANLAPPLCLFLQSCTACLAGSFSPAGASTCTACPSNSVSAALSGTCSCNPGFFANGTGVTLTCNSTLTRPPPRTNAPVPVPWPWR